MTINRIRAGVLAAAVAGAGATAALLGTGDAAAATFGCYNGQTQIASVDTADAAAVICQSPGEALNYRGLTKSTGDTITLPVAHFEENSNGTGKYVFSAHNNGYTYILADQDRLTIVDPSGTMVFSELQN